MPYKYEVYTTIPRNFDPEIEGITLDSIMETCEGYINHSIPLNEEETVINITTSKPLDVKYLTGQLDDNFRETGEQTVIKRIIRKSL